MNYFSHFYVLPDYTNPYLTIGSILPDMLRNAKSEFGNLTISNSKSNLDSITIGINYHIEIDRIFHNSDYFKKTTTQLSAQIRNDKSIEMEKYTQFYAHILIELLIDYDLIKSNKDLLRQFYTLLNLVDYNDIEAYFALMFPSQDLEMFWERFERFKEREFLMDYIDLDKVIEYSFFIYEKATKKTISRNEFKSYKSIINNDLLPIIQEKKPKFVRLFETSYMIKKLLTLCALFLITNSFGQETVFRKYANNFLYTGVDARGRAMGNAVASTSEDAFTGYWNPAGLTGLSSDITQVGYVHIFDGLYNFDVVGLAIPTKKESALALTAVRYGVDDIPNTIFLVDESGNINPDNITTFSAADYGVFLSYAKKLNNRISLGGSAKFVHRNVGEFAKAYGAGIDFGFKYKSENSKFQGAAFARDIFGTYTSWDFTFDDPEVVAAFMKTGNDLPQNGTIEATSPSLVLAGNYLFESGDFSFNPELDLDVTFDGQRNTLVSTDAISIDPHAGLEIGYQKQVFLRAGINNIQEIAQVSNLTETKWEMQPSIGGGLKLSNIEIDYALTQYDLREELTHMIAFKFGLNK